MFDAFGVVRGPEPSPGIDVEWREGGGVLLLPPPPSPPPATPGTSYDYTPGRQETCCNQCGVRGTAAALLNGGSGRGGGRAVADAGVAADGRHLWDQVSFPPSSVLRPCRLCFCIKSSKRLKSVGQTSDPGGSRPSAPFWGGSPPDFWVRSLPGSEVWPPDFKARPKRFLYQSLYHRHVVTRAHVPEPLG